MKNEIKFEDIKLGEFFWIYNKAAYLYDSSMVYGIGLKCIIGKEESVIFLSNPGAPNIENLSLWRPSIYTFTFDVSVPELASSAFLSLLHAANFDIDTGNNLNRRIFISEIRPLSNVVGLVVEAFNPEFSGGVIITFHPDIFLRSVNIKEDRPYKCINSSYHDLHLLMPGEKEVLRDLYIRDTIKTANERRLNKTMIRDDNGNKE